MTQNKNTMESRHIDTELSDRLWMDLYLKKGSGWLAVQTDSMSPLIQPGDQVLISRKIQVFVVLQPLPLNQIKSHVESLLTKEEASGYGALGYSI